MLELPIFFLRRSSLQELDGKKNKIITNLENTETETLRTISLPKYDPKYDLSTTYVRNIYQLIQEMWTVRWPILAYRPLPVISGSKREK